MKKGFTLVELLAIIVIIGIIATIGGMGISSVLDTSRQKSYEQQINNIIKVSKEWAVENTQYLPETGKCFISIKTLVDSGKLEDVPVNPVSPSEKMTGGVEIYFDTNKNQYIYTYKENSSLRLCKD